jgi:hypothetical protein
VRRSRRWRGILQQNLSSWIILRWCLANILPPVEESPYREVRMSSTEKFKMKTRVTLALVFAPLAAAAIVAFGVFPAFACPCCQYEAFGAVCLPKMPCDDPCRPPVPHRIPGWTSNQSYQDLMENVDRLNAELKKQGFPASVKKVVLAPGAKHHRLQRSRSAELMK